MQCNILNIFRNNNHFSKKNLKIPSFHLKVFYPTRNSKGKENTFEKQFAEIISRCGNCAIQNLCTQSLTWSIFNDDHRVPIIS